MVERSIYCISDIHTDHHQLKITSSALFLTFSKRNRSIVESWKGKYLKDVLICCGDISHDLEQLQETLESLVQSFHQVFFVPGNNELRLSKHDDFSDSIEKFNHILSLCEELGVKVKPEIVDDTVLVCPLFTFYTPYFDETYNGDSSYQRSWLDFRKIRFPKDLQENIEQPSEFFLNLNDKESILELSNLQIDKVITFSHYLPRFELLPYRMFMKDSLPLVVGDKNIDTFIREIHSSIHLFGHTHLNKDTSIKDTSIKGVRYVQNALGHPAEQNSIWRKLTTLKRIEPKKVHSYQCK